LDDDVKLYEPKVALDGGIDGYSKTKKVIEKSSKLLKTNGKLVLEIDDKQKIFINEILKENRFYINKIVKDLAKKYRCIVSTKI
jgi:Methylase of polypeptide chain release factors